MTIKVNGKDVTLEKEVTVKELLEIQKVEMPDYVTVQINDKILDRKDFETLTVKEGDVVEFLLFYGRRRDMNFTNEQMERYSRHIILKDVG